MGQIDGGKTAVEILFWKSSVVIMAVYQLFRKQKNEV